MTQLGRYEILQQLSRGSVADVLLARASGLEGFARHVVIKRIRAEVATDSRFVKSFLDEARIGASLNHQNIVQVFDIDEQQGAYFFAMEYIHGEDARKLLAKVRESGTQVPFDQVAAIGAAAAAGLHYAHDHLGPDRLPLGLVHRDVSPGNILIGFDGSVKLVDFALARAALRSAKTRTGSLAGKAPYMSPELCIGNAIDRRSDIFSLGTVMYELVTARRLFKGDNDFLTMAAIVEGDVQPPSVHRPDIPPRLDAIIMRALAKDPAARFQTAHDLQSELESFAMDAELRTSAKALSDYMAKLFGPRLEPWHVGAQAATDSDNSADFDDSKAGLVAAPERGASLKVRLPTNAVSPIAIARNIAESRPDPGVEVGADEEPTSMLAEIVPANVGDSDRTGISTPPEPEDPTANLKAPQVPRPPIVPGDAHATARPPAIDHEREDSELSTQRVPVAPRPPILPEDTATERSPMPRTDTDAGDEATTVMPPLFPMQDPVIPAAPPEAVYAGRPAPPMNPNLKWIAAIGGVLLLLVIGLIARACSSDHVGPAAGPDSGVHGRR